MSHGGTRDRAVSPIIGVIIMVAITVILAAIIGTFVSDMGNDVETNIQAGANIQHDSAGDTIDVVWTSNENAKRITVKFKEEGTGTDIDEKPTISKVGNSESYTCTADGADVRVIVVAKAGGVTSVIQDKTFENC